MSNGVSGVRSSAVQTTPTSQQEVYTVRPGDTLSQIARQYGLSYQELARYNNIADPNRIYPGQEIRIPQTATFPRPTPSTPEVATTRDTFERVNAQEERARAEMVGAPNKKTTQEIFIESIASDAQKSYKTTGVPASITIAQAILETGWGKHTIGEANNFFGMKGKGPAGSIEVTTYEYIDGEKVKITAKFRKYNNRAESFIDHAKSISEGERYKEVMKYKDNPHKFAEELQKAGYATDPLNMQKNLKI